MATEQSGEEVIRLDQVSRRFQDGRGGRIALNAVDLKVRRGEIFGVVGRSGAGKSTLVRTINLLERPDAGRVIIAGQDITSLAPAPLRAVRRRIGMIFQHFNLLHNRTVHANVALPLQLTHVAIGRSCAHAHPRACGWACPVPSGAAGCLRCSR